MPTNTFRGSDTERAELDALAQREGISVSEVIRRALGYAHDAADLASRVETVERRLSALEELAQR